jgi:hypothetical protein
MLKKWCLLILITTITLPSAFSVPQQERSYSLVNISNEKIIINFKTKDFLRNIDHIDGITPGFEYYNDGVNIGRIDSHSRHELYNEFENQILPFRNTFIYGIFSWKYIDLIVISRALFFEYEKDQDGNVIYQTTGGVITPRRKNVRFVELTGKEIFDIFVEEFIITDMSGNIIMTLDDITVNSFRKDYVEDYIEEYTDDFYNTGRYRYIGNNRDLRASPYGIFITDELINEGRRRYMGQIIDEL